MALVAAPAPAPPRRPPTAIGAGVLAGWATAAPAVRPTDRTGRVQAEARADPFADGASGLHAVSVKIEG